MDFRGRGAVLSRHIRHRRRAGSATWSFRLKSTDRASRASSYFDRSQSTIGAHRLRMWRVGKKVFASETVSPRTMITVTSVEVGVSRLYSHKVYRHDSQTITANWTS
jgi:hypothetical protein